MCRPLCFHRRRRIEQVAEVTDKPIKYLLLTHCHAVRVLGASAHAGAEILAAALDARLVLILANHIGDLDVLREAIALASKADRKS